MIVRPLPSGFAGHAEGIAFSLQPATMEPVVGSHHRRRKNKKLTSVPAALGLIKMDHRYSGNGRNNQQ
jgi:hypothetical protein